MSDNMPGVKIAEQLFLDWIWHDRVLSYTGDQREMCISAIRYAFNVGRRQSFTEAAKTTGMLAHLRRAILAKKDQIK